MEERENKKFELLKKLVKHNMFMNKYSMVANG